APARRSAWLTCWRNRRLTVVTGRERQRDGGAAHCRDGRARIRRNRRRKIWFGGDRVAIESSAILAVDDLGELPFEREMGDSFFRVTVSRQRPHQFLLAKVRWNVNLEHELLTARIEVRGLPAIGGARRKVIGRPDRDLRFLLVIPIEVSKNQIERAVGVLFP